MKKLVFVLLALSIMGFMGCPSSGPTLPPTTTGGGFFFSTFTSFNLAPPVIAPVTTIQGTWVKDQPAAVGSPATWTQTSNAAGIGIVLNGRAPADWKAEWKFSLVTACEGQTVAVTVHFVDDDVGLLCAVTTVVLG
ncbi:MAG TPA: hypothetical protein VG649_00620 [Candidatus Angelobacter sp.]|nr:hypothetical protein [Candidatus Angelobacter sp.]